MIGSQCDADFHVWIYFVYGFTFGYVGSSDRVDSVGVASVVLVAVWSFRSMCGWFVFGWICVIDF